MMHFGPNLEIFTSTGDDLLRRQAQNMVNFDFEVEIDLEGHGQSKYFNQWLLHIWSKFGDPSLMGCWVIARKSSWLMHHHPDTRTQQQIKMSNTSVSTVLSKYSIFIARNV